MKFSHPKLVVLNYQQMSICHHENKKIPEEKLIDNTSNNRIKVDFVFFLFSVKDPLSQGRID